jgi:hypothetical protein
MRAGVRGAAGGSAGQLGSKARHIGLPAWGPPLGPPREPGSQEGPRRLLAGVGMGSWAGVCVLTKVGFMKQQQLAEQTP